jgi:hypothetical protein
MMEQAQWLVSVIILGWNARSTFISWLLHCIVVTKFVEWSIGMMWRRGYRGWSCSMIATLGDVRRVNVGFVGVATFVLCAGVATLGNCGGVATLRNCGGVATLGICVGVATLEICLGVATLVFLSSTIGSSSMMWGMIPGVE